jgi:ABC-type nitrate/sulfonate/bicarbonate transport system permease component
MLCRHKRWKVPREVPADTATMFVPIIILIALAIELNALLGWFERVVAPWRDEIAGRN